MATALPEKLKQAATRLREDLHSALDRLLHRNHQNIDGIEIDDKGDEVLIRAAMPGIEPDELSVEIDRNRLILRGQKKIDKEERGKGYYYAEHSLGAFARVIPLPFEVDATRANAKYRNGVLRIMLPKSEQAKQQQTRVRVA